MGRRGRGWAPMVDGELVGMGFIFFIFFFSFYFLDLDDFKILMIC